MAVAAYASVLSLLSSLDNVLLPSRRWMIPDMSQIEALQQKLTSLQEFLEIHSKKSTTNELLRELAVKLQIIEVVHDLADLFDKYIVDRQRTKGLPDDQIGEKMSSSFCQDLQLFLEKIESIDQELTKFGEEDHGIRADRRRLRNISNSPLATSDSSGEKAVGLEDHVLKIMECLTGNERSLQVIPIVGMGGIGKTTLARNTYYKELIVEHFHVRIWITLSQEYDVQSILLSLKKDGVIDGADDDLGTRLFQKLYGRRYLIVMDDVWGIDAWEKFRPFFPNNDNKSRIIVTTRLMNVADSITSARSNSYPMSLLDEESSWKLFSEKAFCNNGGRSTSELEDIGKKIARNCRGLPLTLVVVGGLLSNPNNMSREYWKSVADDVNSFYHLEIDENCLRILYLSYNHLPIHLKACFLRLKEFPEDSDIKVSMLVDCWIAEGIVRPSARNDNKTLEEVAMEYLEDLIGRNMIFVRELGEMGEIRSCGVHDILRQLCVKESLKENIFTTLNMDDITIDRSFFASSCFVCRHGTRTTKRIGVCEVNCSTSSTAPTNIKSRLIRLINKVSNHIFKGSCFVCHDGTRRFGDHKVVLNCSASSTAFMNPMVCDDCSTKYPRLIKSRFIGLINKMEGQIVEIPHTTKLTRLSIIQRGGVELECVSPSPISLLWNLMVLHEDTDDATVLLSRIWEMPQLRKVDASYPVLPDPSDEFIVLENLQTLCTVENMKWTEEVVRRIPNLVELEAYYILEDDEEEELSGYCLNNLALLHKLRSLKLHFSHDCPLRMENIFPNSLTKLALSGCQHCWEDMTVVGSLPNLQVLTLRDKAFVGEEWCMVEGQFLKLKCLKLHNLSVVAWRAEASSSLPALEMLRLDKLKELKEFPLGIGDIDALRSVRVGRCNESVVDWVEQIKDEQDDLGNEILVEILPDEN